MHFDALTLACVADELRATILEGRVQQVLLTDADTIGMELYAQRERQYLLLSAATGSSRVQLSSSKLRRGAQQETPLLLLLRKYVRGAALIDIMQPDAAERVLLLRFDHPEQGETKLVAEPMGRMGNVLLLDGDDTILGTLRRAPKGGSAGRSLRPGQTYGPPAPQEKLPPLDDGRDGYYEQLAAVTAQDGALWKAIIAFVAGISPTQARELAFRATGNAESAARDAESLAIIHALQELWSPVKEGGWLPGNVVEAEAVVAFSPYPIGYRRGFVATSSISAALERFYAAQRVADQENSEDTPDEYAAAREAAAAQLRQARRRIGRQLEALAADEPEPGEPESLRTQAEWLLALGHTVRPGQTTLEVDVNGDGSEMLQIALDKRRTPIVQAQQLFSRAAKLERAASIIPRRRTKLRRDLLFLDQLEIDLSMAENRPEIAAVEEEVRAAGLVRKIAGAKRDKTPPPNKNVRRFTSPGGFEILAGRNARQNETITFGLSHPQDLWLHARGVPGSHVVLRNRGAAVSEDDVLTAAQVAAYYSKARGERSAPVIVTERRHVRRVPRGHTGQVLVRNERNVQVSATMPQDKAED